MNIFKGWLGEKKTTFNMWFSLNNETYQRLHDVIIPASNGTMQIDHILISKHGVFIVETKNLKGWIFGSQESAKWTQTLGKKKYSFQNPLRQTFRQKKVLAAFLNINEHLIHTVVFFVGNCKLKTNMPPNVLSSGLARYIHRFKEVVISGNDTAAIKQKLVAHQQKSNLTTKDHVRSLKARHSSATICPTCGAELVKRAAKKGQNAGSTFYGCSKYPKCRFTKNA